MTMHSYHIESVVNVSWHEIPDIKRRLKEAEGAVRNIQESLKVKMQMAYISTYNEESSSDD